MCHESCIIFGIKSLKKEEVTGKRVLEVGLNKANNSLRNHVKANSPAQYVGVDIAPGPGIDIICNVNDLVKTLGPKSFDLVICTEVLEHVTDWRSAISNLKNVLKPLGVLLLTTRSIGFPYHAYPNDFWRFQPADMSYIFSDFAIETIEADNQYPGVFVKAIKPDNFDELNLANYSVHQMKTKVAFISCVNNEKQYQKSLEHIRNLNCDNIEVEIIKVPNPTSLTKGYNIGMRRTNAKYKVYLHQDAYLLNKNFIHDFLELFYKNPQLGMLGILGAKYPRPKDVNKSTIIYGRIYDFTLKHVIYREPKGEYQPVDFLDGVLLVTQYDVPWREDIMHGFHFYDYSQSLEFTRRGLQIGVVRQKVLWLAHECSSGANKEFWRLRKVFLKSYNSPYRLELKKQKGVVKSGRTRMISRKSRIQKRKTKKRKLITLKRVTKLKSSKR